MAGFKLKELLKHQKQIEKDDKKEAVKKDRKLKELEKLNDEPVVVNHDDAMEQQNVAAADEEVADEPQEEYQSQALSRKERRKLKKQQKKSRPTEENENNDSEAEEGEGDEKNPGKRLQLDKLELSESEDEEEEDGEEKDEENEDQEAQSEDEEEKDIPLSDVEFDSDADVVPFQKVTVNNSNAIKHALERVQLSWNKHSFQEHQSITSEGNTDETIKDIYDDTQRELAFYKQSLDAVLQARQKLKTLKVPFKRPLDYFAEMVKSDEHMDKLKSKLVSEASDRKAREDARKQRQLKKFGKQVQVATLQSRQKEKRETLEKIKSLKKKRKHNEIDDSAFDVGIEEAATEKGYDNRQKPNGKRLAKDAKYGKGGMKRFKRKNDAQSSSDITGFSSNKMKGKPSRPGKSRRTKRF
ncbi:LAQU0S18e02146g1_1 [Lachancea quebecensis]|uniref:LAQU0S18e02146g1_1 n=1 Tax=Lachancea quebecensis TaxID=1654605 RepID=A0A0N7MMC2_9SACH|nr:LAQU0S18e02146g1_1 [Lachancea quebecensis]